MYLKLEIARLKQENRSLKRRLAAIRRFVEKVKHQAGALLSRPSGVARGKWSFAKGADRTADGVLKRC